MSPILFEDNYLLAVNKPAGLQVEADRYGNPSVADEISTYFRTSYPWKKQLIVGLAHRLDRPVSGVLLIAKTPQALKSLNAQFEQRTVSKKYLARVEGELSEASGELVHWLKKDPVEKKAILASRQDKRAAECRLMYKVLSAENGKSLVEVELLTGRYHQIRAQLAAIGAPILGDEKYGSPVRFEGAICLHAYMLAVAHPKTGAELTIQAPLPGGQLWNR